MLDLLDMTKVGRIEQNHCRRITGMITPITGYKTAGNELNNAVAYNKPTLCNF